MALVLQDDTGLVAGANAYISVEYFTDYHAAIGLGDEVTDFDVEDVIKPAIINATAYSDQRWASSFDSARLNGRDQTTEWPKKNAHDRDGNYVTGIPKEQKDAVAEYAYIALTSDLIPNPTTDSTGRQVSGSELKVGPITKKISYIGRTQQVFKLYPKGDNLMRRLIQAGIDGMVARG